jgi:subtilisin family serine protease
MKVFLRGLDKESVGQLFYRVERSSAVVAGMDGSTLIADLPQDEVERLRESGSFEVFDDIQFEAFPPPRPDPRWWERSEAPFAGATWAGLSQRDVMERIRAPQAHAISTGEGITVAVVDTGTAGSMKEFPRRSGFSISPVYQDPWDDAVGHGTMCAAIACGTEVSGGLYSGVAPDATLLSARSILKATDLYLIYSHLLREKRNGSFPRGLVVSNSFGHYECQPPAYPHGHPYADLIRLCVAEGIVFVFAAGNNHAFGLCDHAPDACAPNTIWGANSMDEVITVGTVDWNGSNREPGAEHANSSRGPGQWSRRGDKPDVVAPTYGKVAWGAGYRTMEWWGTSGACPQVAGLAALLLARNPALTPDEIRNIVRGAAVPLPAGAECVGAGLIDCEAALRTL